MRISALVALGLLPTVMPAQSSLSYFEGAANALSLLSVDAANPSAAPTEHLRGLRLRAPELMLRTHQHEVRNDWPRRISRNGVVRIELPAGGRVFHYSRDSDRWYGYVWVDGNGNPQQLLELPGVSGNNPFANAIGVAYDGLHAAFVTRTGRLFVARLDGQNWASTGTPVREISFPAPVEPTGVCVGATHLFCVTDNGRIWRTALTDGSTPSNLTPSGTVGSTVEDEMAMAGDGKSVVFLFGPRKSVRLYLLGSSGAAAVLPPPAADYDDPGYLPGEPNGPHLLLNQDGTRLFYVDSTVREEHYLLDTTAATTPTHVTSDANFEPYIDISIFPSFMADAFEDTLVLGVGDPSAFDLYTAKTGTASVTNLTGTAGAQPPFGAGTLAPDRGYTLRSNLTVFEQAVGTRTELRWVDPITAAGGVLDPDLRAPARLGFGSAPRLLIPGVGGDEFADLSLTPQLVGPAGIHISRDARDASGLAVFLASLAALPAGAGALVFELPGGILVPVPVVGAREFSVGASGVLLNANRLVHISTSGVNLLGAAGAPVRVLAS